MKILKLNRLLLLLLMICLSHPVMAEWTLNQDSSQINFISVKKNKVGEVHVLTGLTGSVNDNGEVSITINLNSVETQIPVRNERLKKLFFETDIYPVATAVTTLDLTEINALIPGQLMTQELTINLQLHGVQAALPVSVQVSALSDHALWVTLTEPVVLNIEDYALYDGLKTLMALAKLPSISTVVPVTAGLLFEAQ
jgi:polyisoprenoid-binding protein YceI